MDRETHDPDAGSARSPDLVPRLVALYRDVIDEDLGAAISWQTVAWGIALPDGSAVTVPVSGPVAVTMWQSVGEAADALDACVDTVDPRHQPANAPKHPGPFRASTTPPPRSSDGDAVQTTCPEQPSRDEGDRDRSLGDDHPAEPPGVAAQGTAS